MQGTTPMRKVLWAAGATGAAIILALAGAAGQPALAAGLAGYCQGQPSHARPQKVPPELETAIAKLLDMDVDYLRPQTFVRCVGPQLMVCVIGANLACGKADIRRQLPSADAFCRVNPDAAIVPFVATGHDTVYEWRCHGRRAVAGKQFQTVDPQGYIAANWRRAP